MFRHMSPILGIPEQFGEADLERMRSITGMCVTFGTLAGGYVPTLWGGSDFSVASLVTAALGGVAGLWLALRLQA